MKKLYLILALLTASPCFGQLPQMIQANVTCSLTNVSVGDVLIVSGGWDSSSSTPSVSDTLSTSFSQLTFNTAHNDQTSTYIGTASSSGADTVTFTVSGSSDLTKFCSQWNFGGISTTVDVSAVTYFSTGNSYSNAITTNFNGDLLYSFHWGRPDVLQPSAPNISLSWSTGGCCLGVNAYIFTGLAGSYTTTYSAPGRGNASSILTQIAFQPTAIQITSPNVLPDGIQGDGYSYNLTAQGGTGAYTWSITSGALPAGLSLNTSSGLISGTPTNSNPNTIVFHVTDGTNSANLSATLHVGSSAVTITHVQDSLVNGIFSSNVTSGDFIGIAFVSNSGFWGTSICSDTRGTSFRLLTVVNANVSVTMYYGGFAPSTGADTVNCGGSSALSASEFTPFQLFTDSIVYDNFPISQTSVTTNSLTTQASNSLILATYVKGDTLGGESPTAPCTLLFTRGATGSGCYEGTTSITGYTVNYTMPTSTSPITTSVMSFRPLSSGDAPLPSGTHPRVISY